MLRIVMTSERRLDGTMKTSLGFASLAAGLFLTECGNCAFEQSPVWTQTSAPNNSWMSLAVSADGSKVVAVAGGTGGPYPQIVGPIYRSTNSGITWDATSAPIASWDGVASSSDGTRLAAVIEVG